MIALFFEVQVKEGHVDPYLDLAASLKPALDAMGGCLFIERFKSLHRKNLLLSYQIWQDEGSMTAWRVDARHHAVQGRGRKEIFADYRIRVAQVVHEERPESPEWRPERLTPYNDPKRRAPTFVVASESCDGELSAETTWKRDAFESVYRPGVFAHLVDAPSYEAGIGFGRQLFSDSTTKYFRVFEVMRDYGMFNRGEAPQYYPPAAQPAQREGLD